MSYALSYDVKQEKRRKGVGLGASNYVYRARFLFFTARIRPILNTHPTVQRSTGGVPLDFGEGDIGQRDKALERFGEINAVGGGVSFHFPPRLR